MLEPELSEQIKNAGWSITDITYNPRGEIWCHQLNTNTNHYSCAKSIDTGLSPDYIKYKFGEYVETKDRVFYYSCKEFRDGNYPVFITDDTDHILHSCMLQVNKNECDLIRGTSENAKHFSKFSLLLNIMFKKVNEIRNLRTDLFPNMLSISICHMISINILDDNINKITNEQYFYVAFMHMIQMVKKEIKKEIPPLLICTDDRIINILNKLKSNSDETKVQTINL